MDRGKRRSRAQRIGVKGESFFKTWAVDHGLSANKVEEDYGVDFFCQLLRPVGKHGSEEATGALLAVQVRATEGKTRPRIKLDRVDATNLLRQQNSACLVAVHVTDQSVRFRFLDEKFISILQNFLSSSNSTLSIQLNDLESDPEQFKVLLKYYSKPGTVQRLMIHKVEAEIAGKIPGSSLSIRQGKAGGMAVIDVPWIGAALGFPSKKAETYRRMVFEEGRLPEKLDELYIKADLQPVNDLVDGGVLVTGRFERECDVTLHRDGKSRTLRFQLRVLADEWAYSHPIGLCFVVSDRRRKNGTYVHVLESRIYRTKLSINNSVEALEFLELLSPETQVMVDGRPFIPLSSWGENITRVGAAIKALRDLSGCLGFPLDNFLLADLKDEEFGRALSILDAALLQDVPLSRLVHSFILGPLADQEVETIPTKAVIMALPIVLNLKGKGFILWAYGPSLAFVDNRGLYCGFKFGDDTEWTVEAHKKFKKSKFPELWITEGWPAMTIGEKTTVGLQNIQISSPSVIGIEAIIRPIETTESEPKKDAPEATA